jgi:2-C-methyl-D-erythritol 4-phosphate cytidylyltransferase
MTKRRFIKNTLVDMKKNAVIVAGGNGLRMGAFIPKQFLLLKGKPLLWHTLNTFLNAYDDMQVILVLPEEHIERGEAIVNELENSGRVVITKGGATRYHSVQNGLKLVAENSIVFVHDGVRCLISKDLIQRCYEQALKKGSAIPEVAATDSIRIATDDNNSIVADRTKVRIIQTPQTFKSEIIVPAFNQTYNDAFTDEATVVEAFGTAIFLVEGDYNNIKVTRPVDLVIAEKILEEL